MTSAGWIFWKITCPDGDELVWLGITRPRGRSAIDRAKMWTLLPRSRVFIANWYVTEDFMRSPAGGQWRFENVDVSDARAILHELPDPSSEELSRITRPERVLTLDQIDRVDAMKVLGKRAGEVLADRH